MGNSSGGRWGRGRRPPNDDEPVTTVDEGPAEPSSGAPVGATLEILAGPDAGTTQTVEAEIAILGRASNAEVRFTDPSISRHHVRIERRNGIFHLRELGSSNGTRVDGRNVRGTIVLRPRCRIRLGKRTSVEFTAVDEAGLRRVWQRMHLEARLDLERMYSRNLAAQATQLRRALDDLDQFAAVASHDLRAPLHTVGSLAELMALQYEHQLDDKAREYLGLIAGGVQRMDNLLGDLRSWSRVRADGEHEELVDLDEAADDALANLGAELGEASAVIERKPLPVVVGHRSPLVQMLQNLLSNAMKFHGESGPTIGLSAARKGNEWIVTVTDDGIGMNMSQAARVFEVFQRLHTQDEYPGTGMGLAIVKRVVDLHNGRVWLESTPGRGTAFHVALPDREEDVFGARETEDPDDESIA